MTPSPRLPRRSRVLISLCLLAAALIWWHSAPIPAARAQEPRLAGLADLTLEQLSDIEVTTISRRTERLGDAPASIFVITSEDIRRSGALTLPEALRLAPILEVARADANQYAVTARGFNSVLTNKLLVMIDGRTVYSPLFSGVFWESQDLLLEDIDRIEVLSGPGGTLWGTNAVNGIINIVTRSAEGSQGSMVTGGWGTDAQTGAARHGGSLGAKGHYRVFGKTIFQDETERADGTGVGDASSRYSGGFRADWNGGANRFTVQGDGFSGHIDQGTTTRELGGVSVLGRWSRQVGDRPGIQVLAYYDRTTRDQPGAIREELNTFEVDVQHGFRPATSHNVIWGAGYRYQPDRVENLNPAAFAFIPPNRRLAVASGFVQDDIRLLDRVTLTAGVKLEHNQYTQLEYMPSFRIAWRRTDRQLAWVGLSRAVRAPSRIDREFYSPGAPPHFFLAGGPEFRSEITNVAELGYRASVTGKVSVSTSASYNDWDRLRSIEPSPSGPVFANGIEGFTKGMNAWAEYRAFRFLRLSGGWVMNSRHLHVKPGRTSLGGIETLGNDPSHWWSARSSLDLGRVCNLDVMVRRVGARPSPHVPSYTAVDGRIAFVPHRTLEISAFGRNLFDSKHAEWGVAPGRPEFERELFAGLTYRP